jgi:uncharacterized protein YqeY
MFYSQTEEEKKYFEENWFLKFNYSVLAELANMLPTDETKLFADISCAYIIIDKKTKDWNTSFTFGWLYRNQPPTISIDELKVFLKSDNRVETINNIFKLKEMSTLKEQIQSRTVVAMKAKDKDTVGVLRNIKALITEAEKEKGNDITDEAVQKLISKYVKQREEGLAQANEIGRDDLAEKESFEISVLDQYLPKVLDESATRKIVEDLISNGADNIGAVMKGLSEFGNTIDKKIASQIARELL